MAERLKDIRLSIQNMEQAEAEFATLAKAKIECAKIDATAEAHIASIKATADCEKEYHQAVIAKAERDLAAFIEANPDQFSKPRKHKTDWGTFGLHTVTNVNVYDKDATILHCECNEARRDCLRTTITVLTTPIGQLLKEGHDIPGCELITGDTAICTVKKELLDKAKENA